MFLNKYSFLRQELHQTEHFSTGFIGEPTGQLKDFAKSTEFDRAPVILFKKINNLSITREESYRKHFFLKN